MVDAMRRPCEEGGAQVMPLPWGEWAGLARGAEVAVYTDAGATQDPPRAATPPRPPTPHFPDGLVPSPPPRCAYQGMCVWLHPRTLIRMCTPSHHGAPF